MSKKKILLFTSTNLACNPRCLKEVKLLKDLGAAVTVVAFILHNWTTEKEVEINRELEGVDFFYLETTKKDFVRWAWSSLVEKTARFLLPVFSSSLFITAMAVSKRTWLLKNWCRQTTLRPDIIIAHNPSAFYPAYWLAKKNGVHFALDIEDYHPGEAASTALQKAVALVMSRLIPLAYYNSFASPLIKEYSEKLPGCGNLRGNIIVNNIFPAAEFDHTLQVSGRQKLQLVWFSQFIDFGRGLENIFSFLDGKEAEIELTLIGSLRQMFYIKEVKNRKYIHCIPPMAQTELHKHLSRYDVGLALEDTSTDLNRSLCLTNKIWAYHQAGLCILATDTPAQKRFIYTYQHSGVCTSASSLDLSSAIEKLIHEKVTIRSKRIHRIAAASTINWEVESVTLKEIWSSVWQ